jgi:hypothetical protein
LSDKLILDSSKIDELLGNNSSIIDGMRDFAVTEAIPCVSFAHLVDIRAENPLVVGLSPNQQGTASLLAVYRSRMAGQDLADAPEYSRAELAFPICESSVREGSGSDR